MRYNKPCFLYNPCSQASHGTKKYCMVLQNTAYLGSLPPARANEVVSQNSHRKIISEVATNYVLSRNRSDRMMKKESRMNMLSERYDQPVCETPQSVTERLSQKRRRLVVELEAVEKALVALEKNPEVQLVLDALTKINY